MTYPTTVQALGQARLAELHYQAQRAAQARAARRARQNQRRQHVPGFLGGLAGWARRPGPAPGSS